MINDSRRAMLLGAASAIAAAGAVSLGMSAVAQRGFGGLPGGRMGTHRGATH
jgi:hypothetical protein